MPSNTKKIAFNYVYFGLFFALLLLLCASSIFTKESLGGSRIFFFFYSLGQITLETSLLIFGGWLAQRYLPKIWFWAYIGATFICLLLHVLDFLMNRILDLSIWETMGAFVLDESWENFVLLLEASGIPFWVWILIFAALAALPLLGVLLYKSTAWIAERRPLLLRREWFFQTFLCIPCALFLWDYSAASATHPNAYTAFIKSLPWKFTFIQPKHAFLSFKTPIQPPPLETEIAAQIAQDQTTLAKRPNIYLFVVESLRDDFLNEEVAPHLYGFKNSNPHFDLTLSNANGTHLSWFSIFHSQFAFCWKNLQSQNWRSGSPALQLLKKWGYQIRLYSAAHLSYYGMEDLIFGKDLKLADHHSFFAHVPPTEAWQADAAALDQIQKDIAENPSLEEGQVFLIFWDSTHFDYSWPKKTAARFTPFAKEFAYFRAFNTKKNVELIKNRYRNAVHYMDSLFGSFLAKLPRKDEAIVVFTGDHGEEFFEHGHLFHGSQLSHEQTNVPIYFKFGQNKQSIPNLHLAAQMNIFPSILHYLSGKPVAFWEGLSIFEKDRWAYAVTARFNAGRAPYEFSLHNGKHKLVAQFQDRRNIFDAKTLQILSLRACKDKNPSECRKQIETWIDEEFGPAFHRLFRER